MVIKEGLLVVKEGGHEGQEVREGKVTPLVSRLLEAEEGYLSTSLRWLSASRELGAFLCLES